MGKLTVAPCDWSRRWARRRPPRHPALAAVFRLRRSRWQFVHEWFPALFRTLEIQDPSGARRSLPNPALSADAGRQDALEVLRGLRFDLEVGLKVVDEAIARLDSGDAWLLRQLEGLEATERPGDKRDRDPDVCVSCNRGEHERCRESACRCCSGRPKREA